MKMERIIDAIEEKLKSQESEIYWRNVKIEALERELKKAQADLEEAERVIEEQKKVIAALECADTAIERKC